MSDRDIETAALKYTHSSFQGNQSACKAEVLKVDEPQEISIDGGTDKRRQHLAGTNEDEP